jgi:hypothetical protein
VKCAAPSSHPAESLRLEAVTACVNFDDFLDYTVFVVVCVVWGLAESTEPNLHRVFGTSEQ